jgi:hypothetical protein
VEGFNSGVKGLTDISVGREQVQMVNLKLYTVKRSCLSGGSDRESLFTNQAFLRDLRIRKIDLFQNCLFGYISASET